MRQGVDLDIASCTDRGPNAYRSTVHSALTVQPVIQRTQFTIQENASHQCAIRVAESTTHDWVGNLTRLLLPCHTTYVILHSLCSLPSKTPCQRVLCRIMDKPIFHDELRQTSRHSFCQGCLQDLSDGSTGPLWVFDHPTRDDTIVFHGLDCFNRWSNITITTTLGQTVFGMDAWRSHGGAVLEYARTSPRDTVLTKFKEWSSSHAKKGKNQGKI